MLKIPVKTILGVIIRCGLRIWKARIVAFCTPNRKKNVRLAPGWN
jgi:hypothetical protein